MFLQVSVILSMGGCAWLLWGGMRGCSRGGMCGCCGVGACVVALGGGMHGCSRGACMVAPGGVCVVAPRGGGMRGCSQGRGHAWLLQEGGHAWLLLGGMCGCSRGGVNGCLGGVHGFSDEIWSMSGRYASYWNAFLFLNFFHFTKCLKKKFDKIRQMCLNLI